MKILPQGIPIFCKIYSYIKLYFLFFIVSMQNFYTVDRLKNLLIGQQIDLNKNYLGQKFYPVEDIYTESDLKTHLNELFPEGVSSHAVNYLTNYSLILKDSNTGQPLPCVPHIPMIEMVFELVRRTNFYDNPSRFQSMFAWDSIERANQFRHESQYADAPIFKLQCETFFCADMRLLLLGGSC
jgi:hypothetical protein